jgi:transcriptional regulator with XRE-family HTH domain
MTRGAQIRKARKEREWSLALLAARSGLSKTYLCKLENDYLSVKASDWVLLRRFLDLPSALPYEGRLPLPPACFRALLPKLKSESTRCWKSRLPAARSAFGDTRVSQRLAEIDARADGALCHHFLEQVETDSAWELFLWLLLLALGAKPAWYSPLGSGFRKHAVVDAAGQKQIGDLRRPCLSWESGTVKMIIFPQVSLRTPRCVYRLDALVCVVRGRRREWIDLEVDGPGHDAHYDLMRQRTLGLTTLRLGREQLRADDPALMLARAFEALVEAA